MLYTGRVDAEPEVEYVDTTIVEEILIFVVVVDTLNGPVVPL